MDAAHVGPVARRRVERAGIRGEVVEPGAEDPAHLGVEARADLAGEPERSALGLADADGDGAELAGVALPRGPATHDERLLGTRLDLQPGGGPSPRLVAAAAVLGDDALEALRGRSLVERPALALDMGGETDPGSLGQDRSEQPLARLERDLEQRPPVELEQVEDLVDDRRAAGLGGIGLVPALWRSPAGPSPAPSTGNATAGCLADPQLEEREVGPAGGVERHHLTVEDRGLGVEPRPGVRQEPREVRRGVVAVAGVRLDRAVCDDRLDAVAVPLDLEQPVVVVERAVGQCREHRLDEARLAGRGLGLGEVDLGDGCGLLADPVGVAGGLDLVVRPAGLDARRVVLGVPAVDRRLVALLDQQPLLGLVVLEGPLAGLAPTRLDDGVAAAELRALQAELQLAVGDRLPRVRGLGLGLPGPPVPDDHVAGAVLLRRDHALEVEVLDRVVLDVDRHPALLRVEGGAARHGPAHEEAVDLEAEVVVEPGRAMTLDDEPTGRRRRRIAGRLGGLREVALLLVSLEGHRRSVCRDRPRRGWPWPRAGRRRRGERH